MSDAQFRPQDMTRLRGGRYTLVCSGPDGVIFILAMDLASRGTFECHLDDDRLQELLVVTSVAADVVENELHKTQRQTGEGGAAEA